jgi:hypothetical protein
MVLVTIKPEVQQQLCFYIIMGAMCPCVAVYHHSAEMVVFREYEEVHVSMKPAL